MDFAGVACSSRTGIFISAPGKIILYGEHAVVYGKTAVAGSIDLRTYVSLYTSADGVVYLSLPDLGVEKTWPLKELRKTIDKLCEDEEELVGVARNDGGGCEGAGELAPSLETLVPLARRLSGSGEDEGQSGVQQVAILAFWYLLLGAARANRDLQAVKVTVRFKLPSCVGLGSSGAYCVCIAAALLTAAAVIPPPCSRADAGASSPEGDLLSWDDQSLDTIRKWASAAESLIHGRASGLDAAICTYGGVASFCPGTRIRHIRDVADIRVLLVNSKVERSTSRMVATVKEKRSKFPAVVAGIFDTIDAISKEASRILEGEANSAGATTADSSSEHNGPYSARSLVEIAVALPANQQQQQNGDSGAYSLQASPASERHSRHNSGGSKRDSSSTSSTATAALALGADGEGYARLNDLCRINNQLLIALGVGHPKLEQISTLLSRYGIYPKMTGAGGGGSLFAFVKPDTSQTVLDMISEEVTKMGFEMWRPQLGSSGVRLHETRPEPFTRGK